MGNKGRAGSVASARSMKRRTAEQVALADLATTARELAKLDGRRDELLRRRDRLVGDARRQGVSWARVAAAAGVSAPALVQRGRRVNSDRAL